MRTFGASLMEKRWTATSHDLSKSQSPLYSFILLFINSTCCVCVWQIKSEKDAVDRLIKQIKLENPKEGDGTEEKMKKAKEAAVKAEEGINDLEQKYRGTKHSELITMFCEHKKSLCKVYKYVYGTPTGTSLQFESEVCVFYTHSHTHSQTLTYTQLAC